MTSRESIRSSAYNPLDVIADGKWKIRLLESMILDSLSLRENDVVFQFSKRRLRFD